MGHFSPPVTVQEQVDNKHFPLLQRIFVPGSLNDHGIFLEIFFFKLCLCVCVCVCVCEHSASQVQKRAPDPCGTGVTGDCEPHDMVHELLGTELWACARAGRAFNCCFICPVLQLVRISVLYSSVLDTEAGCANQL